MIGLSILDENIKHTKLLQRLVSQDKSEENLSKTAGKDKKFKKNLVSPSFARVLRISEIFASKTCFVCELKAGHISHDHLDLPALQIQFGVTKIQYHSWDHSAGLHTSWMSGAPNEIVCVCYTWLYARSQPTESTNTKDSTSKFHNLSLKMTLKSVVGLSERSSPFLPLCKLNDICWQIEGNQEQKPDPASVNDCIVEEKHTNGLRSCFSLAWSQSLKLKSRDAKFTGSSHKCKILARAIKSDASLLHEVNWLIHAIDFRFGVYGCGKRMTDMRPILQAESLQVVWKGLAKKSMYPDLAAIQAAVLDNVPSVRDCKSWAVFNAMTRRFCTMWAWCQESMDLICKKASTQADFSWKWLLRHWDAWLVDNHAEADILQAEHHHEKRRT